MPVPRILSPETGKQVRQSEKCGGEMDRDFSGLKMIGIAKWLLVVIAVVVIIMQSVSGRSSNTSITMMRDKVTEAADLTKMPEGDNQMIRRLYGLDVSQYEGIVLYYPVTNMGAEELLLVKMNDKSQQEEVRAAIEKRLETQKKSFAGYGVDQTAMLEKSVIDIRGNYAFFGSAEDPEALHKAFEKAY